MRKGCFPRHLAWARLALLAGLLPAMVASARGAGKELRIGVMVGNNLGNDSDRSLRYAEDEVGRLAELLRGAGDFERVDIVRGAQRHQVEQILRSARAALEAGRAAGRTTLFLFYYSGHGDNEALELGDSRFPLRDLRGYLEQMPADVRLAFVDACQSGALTGVKGGRRAPAYEVRLSDTGAAKGMAIVTSSTANELSQESDDLRGSYFSHNILSGLRGAADLSQDGQVTLRELYDFAFTRTLANTAASLIGGQHPTYDYRMSGAGDVVLTHTRPQDARLLFPRENGVTYTLFHGGDVTAELTSSPAEDLYLALPAGHYQVMRRALATMQEVSVDLLPGSRLTLAQSAMGPVLALNDANQRKKGEGRRRHTVGAGFGAQTGALDGAARAMMSVGLSYRQDFARWSLRARGEGTIFDGDRGGFRSSYLGIVGSLDGLLLVVQGERFGLLAGPSVGIPFVRQRDHQADTTSVSYGFCYGGVVSALVRLSSRAGIEWSLFGGGEIFRLDQRQVQRGMASSTLSALLTF